MYANTDGVNTKLYKVSFNDLARQPQVTDIIHANNKITYLISFSLAFLILIALAIEFITASI